MKACMATAAWVLIAGCAAVPPPDEADAGAAIAAAVPDTDIYVAALDRIDGRWTVGVARNLTRRAGYDNQPAFDPTGAYVLFSSIRDGVQADVFRIDLANGAVTQLTRTPESEYSPTPLPDGGFSAVRVEADGTQRLWRFDTSGAAEAPIRGDITGVGYHAWLPGDALALFIVDEPVRLVIADAASSDPPQTVATNIGRALQVAPGDALTYVHRPADGIATIRQNRGGDDRLLTQVVADAEDFAWLPDGSVLMASGQRLYRWRDDGRGWRDFAELDVDGAISRLAVAPDSDRLALVVTRNPQ